MEVARVILVITAMFILVQAIGMTTANEFNQLVQAGEIEPAFEDPSNPANAVGMFAYLLVMTGILLAAIRYKKKLLLVFEALAIFLATDIVLELLIPVTLLMIPLGTVLAAAITAWKMLKPTILNQNIALILSVSGAGAILGASMGILPTLILMLLLAIYDFIAVFLTKHMVYLAKAVTERPTAFTAAIPYKFSKPTHVKSIQTGKKQLKKAHTFQLGGGDFAIPLVFTSSILVNHSVTSAIITSIGATLSLFILFYMVMKEPGRPLPALPPICAGATIAFLLSTMV